MLRFAALRSFGFDSHKIVPHWILILWWLASFPISIRRAIDIADQKGYHIHIGY